MNETLSSATLTCLKCGGAMRSYERSGVLIDQCTECRGVFLDRGELDRIIDAESGAGTPAPVARDDRRPEHEARRHESDRHSRDEEPAESTDADDDERRRAISDATRQGAGSTSRKRGGLFGDVLDMFGGGE